MQRSLRLPPEVAEDRAEQVLDLFGVDSHITDNRLDPAFRTLFYQLEHGGLMTTRSETTVLTTGQEWRTHYWVLKMDRIRNAARSTGAADAPRPPAEEETASVYRSLPEGCWQHH